MLSSVQFKTLQLRAHVCGWSNPCSHTGILCLKWAPAWGPPEASAGFGKEIRELREELAGFLVKSPPLPQKRNSPLQTQLEDKWLDQNKGKQPAPADQCTDSADTAWAGVLDSVSLGARRRWACGTGWDGPVFSAAPREGSFLFLFLSTVQMPSWNTPEFWIQGPRDFLLRCPAWEKPHVVGSRGSGQFPWPLHLRPCDPMWKFSFLSITALRLTSCLFVGFPFFF